jgi:hypothetical protein
MTSSRRQPVRRLILTGDQTVDHALLNLASILADIARDATKTAASGEDGHD